MSWTEFFICVAIWFAFGGIPFLIAFIKALIAYRNFLQLTPVEQQHIVLACATSAAKWFEVGFMEAFTVWTITLAANGTAGFFAIYTSFDVLIFAILFPICALLLPKEVWEFILKILKPILAYFGHEQRATRLAATEAAKKARIQIRIDVEKAKAEAQRKEIEANIATQKAKLEAMEKAKTEIKA